MMLKEMSESNWLGAHKSTWSKSQDFLSAFTYIAQKLSNLSKEEKLDKFLHRLH